MESPHDFDAVHWDHEPVWVVPSVWCPAFRRPGPAKAGTPNRRFMERLKRSGGVLATELSVTHHLILAAGCRSLVGGSVWPGQFTG